MNALENGFDVACSDRCLICNNLVIPAFPQKKNERKNKVLQTFWARARVPRTFFGPAKTQPPKMAISRAHRVDFRLKKWGRNYRPEKSFGGKKHLQQPAARRRARSGGRRAAAGRGAARRRRRRAARALIQFVL